MQSVITSFGQFHHVLENKLGLFIPNFPKKNNMQLLVQTLKEVSPLNLLFRKLIYIWVGLPDFRGGQVENLG